MIGIESVEYYINTSEVLKSAPEKQHSGESFSNYIKVELWHDQASDTFSFGYVFGLIQNISESSDDDASDLSFSEL